jgi:hypothetical protein
LNETETTFFASHPPAALLRTTPAASKPASIRAFVTCYQIASSLRKWKSGLKAPIRRLPVTASPPEFISRTLSEHSGCHDVIAVIPASPQEDGTMATFFQSVQADPAVFEEKTIAIIGYGNQGRSQAINLRRSGHHVIVGNQVDESWERAQQDEFEIMSIDEASSRVDIVMLLLPDEIAPATYQRMIGPHLSSGKTLVFASGYNITYKFIVPPSDVDVVLVAPRMIGQGVLDRKSVV